MSSVFTADTVTIPTHAMPLVAAQPGIWMADKLSACPASWSVAHFIELNGDIQPDLLSQAIVSGMAEADTLRMCFAEQDGLIWQWTDNSLPLSPPQLIDLTEDPQPQASAWRIMQADRQQDLRLNSQQPLYFHCLLRLEKQRWFWYQRYHHLLVDGYSFTAITRRIAQLYCALCQRQTAESSPFTAFAEVVQEYQQYQQSASYRRDAEFWQQRTGQMSEPVTLSANAISSEESCQPLIRQQIVLSQQDFTALNRQLCEAGLSSADMLLALVSLWLGRLANRTQFSAGFIFMRRMGSAALCASGPVINVLPYEVSIAPEQTLGQLAQQLAQQMKQLRRHQRYDAEQIQRDRGINGVQQAMPLYSAVVNLKLFDYRLDFNGVAGITHQLASGPVRDLEIAIYLNEQQQATIEILANPQRYCADRLERHLQRMALLLRQFAANPALPCSAASILLEDEQQQLSLINARQTAVASTTLSQLLATQASRSPDAPALADEQHQFSYRQMREQVLALAQCLREQGIQPGDLVAVALPRSVFLSLALQAIVEVGAAWLPLDTGYPDQRLQFMLQDARPRLLISQPRQLARFSALAQLPVLSYERCLPVMESLPVTKCASLALSRPEHTAYVIYTSGSTGQPKGVIISQKAIVNRLLWMQHQYPLQAGDVVLQKTPCSFDVSVWEFFWPLLCGAQLVMAPPEAHRDPQALRQLFAHWQITTSHFVPSMLAEFISELNTPQAIASCRSLRQLFCSGEALPVSLCRQWQQLTGVPLHNLYGPTEAAVDISWYPAFGESLASVTGNQVPIGWPVWNSGLHILDAALRPLPPGVTGELYLSGVQLADGYLARAELTASRFIHSPSLAGATAGERLYRSGDLARRLENGAVEYLGRTDDQLKLRGQRIEPAEIEAILQQLSAAASVVVHASPLHEQAAPAENNGGDNRQLLAYLVPQAGQTLDTQALKQQLTGLLPAHMLPAALIVLTALPLTANGKLDRKALPRPDFSQRASTATSGGRAPAAGMETLIAAAFSQLLNCEIQYADQDFFALGGHSLLAMRLAAILRRQLACPVSVGQIMIASSVAALAQELTNHQDQQHSDMAGFTSVLPLRQGREKTLFCLHPASGFAWQFSVLQRYLAEQWSIIGIQSPRPDGAMQRASSLAELVELHLHSLRQIQPHGPWYFLGYSLGGTLAHAIAARLQQQGEQVAFLGLLDTWPPETQNWSAKNAAQRNPAVLAEIQRERQAFLASQISQQQGQQTHRLFNIIEENYADAVRLLSSAHSVHFAGKATLFVAQKTLPADISPQQAWQPWTQQTDIYQLDCSHVDIISPGQFQHLGPLINRLLSQCC